MHLGPALAHASTSPAKPRAIVAVDAGAQKRTGRRRGRETYLCELPRASYAVALHQDLDLRARLPGEIARKCDSTFLPEVACALLDEVARYLRHALSRRAVARGEGKYVQKRQAAVVDDAQGVGEHRLGLGGEARDQIGAEDHVGTQAAHVLAKAHRVGAGMAPLHALQDHVVTRLHGEMQVRHEPLLLGDRPHQVAIRLDLVDGGEPQALKLGNMLEDLAHQRAERGGARQVLPVGGDVDARQHHLAAAALDEAADLRHDRACWNRPRRPATERNDAEGAAVIAAVLHLHVGACARAEAVDQMPGGLAHAHDVVDLNPLGGGGRELSERLGPDLLGVADDVVDLGKRGKALRLHLGRAAGDDDARLGVLAAPACGSPASPGAPPRPSPRRC